MKRRKLITGMLIAAMCFSCVGFAPVSAHASDGALNPYYSGLYVMQNRAASPALLTGLDSQDEDLEVTAKIPLKLRIPAGSELSITAEFSELEGDWSYQWYKDGEVLDGQTEKTLSIPAFTEDMAGSYTVKAVIRTPDHKEIAVTSNDCAVKPDISATCTHEQVVVYPAEESTCTYQGVNEYTVCKVCDSVISGSDERLPLAPHELTEQAPTQPTHTEAGHIRHFTCANCGKMFSDEIGATEVSAADVTIAPTGHVFGEGYDSDVDGHWKVCECGEMSEKEAHSLANIAEEKYLVSDQDEDAVPMYYKSCSVCGYMSDETFSADEVDDHTDLVLIGEIKATCTTDGYTGDYYCNQCGQVMKTGSVIAATGHALTKTDAKEATHEEDGNIEYYTCSLCNKLFNDANPSKEITKEDTVIAKGEHDYGDGYKMDETDHWKECSCGSVIDKSVHSFGDWSVTKEPTVTETGSKERVCAICGCKEAEIIPVLTDTDPSGDEKDPANSDDNNGQDQETTYPSPTQLPETDNNNTTNTTKAPVTETVKSAPKTGDYNQLPLWIAISLSSTALFCAAGFVMYKKQKK